MLFPAAANGKRDDGDSAVRNDRQIRHYPVIVGVGRLTQRRPATVDDSHTPISFMAAAAEAAARDAFGCRASSDSGRQRTQQEEASSRSLLEQLDAVATVRMQLELQVNGGKPGADKDSLCPNPARSLKLRLGIPDAALEYLSDGHSGNAPQMCVNDLSEAISRGEIRSGLIAGAELNATLKRALQEGRTLPGMKKNNKIRDLSGRFIAVGKEGHNPAPPLPWEDIPEGGSPPGSIASLPCDEAWITRQEGLHGCAVPLNCYALMEQAIRKRAGTRSLLDTQPEPEPQPEVPEVL